MERIQDSLLKASVARGEKDAIIVDGKATSYADLVRGVGAVAQDLEQAGTKPGDRVAFESDSKLTFIQTFFGVVSVGAVAVPIAEGAEARRYQRFSTARVRGSFCQSTASARGGNRAPCRCICCRP